MMRRRPPGSRSRPISRPTAQTRRPRSLRRNTGTILVILLIIALLGGFSGRFAGYGYGYGYGYDGIGVLGTILIIIVVLMRLGRI